MNKLKSYVAAIVAVASVVGFSSFKMLETEKIQAPYYPNVNGIYQPTPLNISEKGTTWDCNDNPTENCAAQFSTPPSSTNQQPTGNVERGHFEELD